MKKIILRLCLILLYSIYYFSGYSQSFQLFIDGSGNPVNIKNKTSIELESKPNNIIVEGNTLKSNTIYRLLYENDTIAILNSKNTKTESIDTKKIDFSKAFQILENKKLIISFSIKKAEVIKQEDTSPEICDCNTIEFNKNDSECKAIRTLQNNFGEDPTTYDEDKIVYIYDFNKDINKRGFYKVIRNKDKDKGLKILKDIETIKFEIKLNKTKHSTESPQGKIDNNNGTMGKTKESERGAIIDDGWENTPKGNIKNNNTQEKKLAKLSNSDNIEINDSTALNQGQKNNNTEKNGLEEKLKNLEIDYEKYQYKNIVDKMPSYSLITAPVNFSKEVLKSRNHVQFKVVNINRFLYNVSIEDSIVKFDSQPSTLLDQFFFGDTTLLQKVTTAFGNNKFGGRSANSKDSTKSKKDNSLLCKIRCFAQNYIALNSKMLEAYDPCSEFPCCQKLIPAYEQLAKDLFEIKLDSATSQQTLIKNLNTELTNSKAIQSACNQKKEKLTKLQRDTEIIKAKKEADLTIKDKENLASFPEDEKKLKADLCSDSIVTSIEKQIKDLANKIKINNAISELSKSLPTEIQIKKAIVFIQHMIDINKTYMHERVSLNGNQLELKLRISSKDSITKYFSIPDYKNKEIPFIIPIKGRPFISFSSGSYVIADKSLVNKTYDWQPLPNNSGVIGKDSARYILTESGYSAPMMGFAALANAEIKLSRFFGVGLSTGVGLTIETKPRLAYLLGGSLFLGELRQFAITAGWAVTQVDKLNNNLLSAYNERVSYTSPSIQDIKYYQEAKAGFFLAITYTPFKAARSR